MSTNSGDAQVDQGFVPNFTVQPAGTTTWAEPGTTGVALDANLPVQVLEWREGWARIVCSNGWEAWVDGRELVRIEAAPPPPEVDELTQLLAEAADRYQETVAQVRAGALSPDEFRREAFTIGHIVKDDAAYMYDAATQMWMRYDGTALAPMT
jgi:hypothetical protein